LERSALDLIYVISRHLPGQNDEKSAKYQPGVLAEIRIEYISDEPRDLMLPLGLTFRKF
jgi:hypothetical protein